MSGRHAAPSETDTARFGGDSGDSDGSGGSGESGGPAPTIRVLSGNPSPAELAAVTAVLAALEAERAAEAAAEKPPLVTSAWEQSRRGLRTPITVGPGQWARHSG